MAKTWECDGVPKDGKSYANQNPKQKHEPYENFGADCVICSLPKEAMVGGSSKPSGSAIAAAVASLLTLAGITGGYRIWQSQSCPKGEQKINDTCVTVRPSAAPKQIPIAPNTPAPTNTYATLAKVPNIPRGIFRYGGSTTFAPLRNPAIVEQIRQAHAEYELVYTEPPPGNKPGSGIGIKMLIDGQLSFSQSSRPLKDDEYKKAKDRNFQLEQIPVAIDGITIYVNPQISITNLTVSQIKDIFTGKINNWKQVGGSDLAIIPISRDPEDGGTPEYFKETVLEQADFANSVQPYARDTTGAIRKVATTPGGIGYATASEVCNQTLIKPLSIGKSVARGFVAPCNGKEVNKTVFVKDTYPITRRLFVVIKRDGKFDEQSGVAYANILLSDEGQQIVNQAGLIPLR
ncbi:phosphate ABC transporter substrate-binding protein [Aetokthonos hydrillicola Thurmond2011]|jgi:phosphate transport system substrate-binding protein|uniref:Phosphate ABC transporter substrate-binding protein n=1 Tax=Aetokthonos hydrillicola Thurmond2011 TaxID=2712845 RepID=A0AAP5M8S9_9CYAN|nr:phosphate ABC transporter substrate-binding protein [Aetokthonos hydrillicola]MBO3458269.1 phosphate ABC transporter substrate-binding protein [Aetokthonos hydrillicola CCALA 1050]MBW4586731.1 phosphate ABC transporter substrate-binding protein [Aetokthonos hydrillicola CCALA 1050]MDR9893943.1 phosphate ABC transporter substrate-binding protein [Aetokthonos hydrillicola Thurmond2011]